MDAEGEIEISVRGGKHLDVNIIGQNFNNYDAMISLAHFKGHPMGGFGGVLKNQSIGIALSSRQGLYPYGTGRSRDLEKFLHCFDTPEATAAMLPPQDDFLESILKPPSPLPTIIMNNRSPFSISMSSIIFRRL